MSPISERVAQPTPLEVRAARLHAELNQEQAATLVSAAQHSPRRTWQSYEVAEGNANHRAIPLAVWELFLLQTGQHPTHRLVPLTAEASVPAPHLYRSD